MGSTVTPIECRSILTRCGIPCIDYSVNPYVGCAHACVYCYAPCVVGRFRADARPWGSFVDVKANAAARLGACARRVAGKTVLFSSVTDPYQPAEGEWHITRACLARLADSGALVSILTKSDMVLRDLDVLTAIGRARVEVGFSVSTGDDDVAAVLEPGAPSPSRRFAALEELARAGFETWVFIAPALPGISETARQLGMISRRARAAGARRVEVDPFNFYPPMTAALLHTMTRRFPDRVARFRDALEHRADFISRVHAAASEVAQC